MIIFRYLCKELYTHLLAITLVLLIIFITNMFVQYMQLVATGQLTTTALMKIMSLQIPLLLGYLLPLSFYLSTLLVFGRFYTDHEMTVLSACGVSKTRLLGMVMVFGFVIMVIVAWLMLWVSPVLENLRLAAFEEVIKNGAIEKLLPKQFQSIGDLGVFYAKTIHRDTHQMQDIFLALKNQKQSEKTGQKPWDITVAKNAQSDSDEHLLVFKDGHRYLGTPGENNFQVMKFDEYGIRLNPAWHVPTKRLDHVATADLWKMRHTTPKAAAALQWRLAMPISVFIFALLAIPLSRSNPRLGRFTRLFPAILIYTIYADLMFLSRAWIEKETISSAVGMWWLHGALFSFAMILYVFDIKGWRRLFIARVRVRGTMNDFDTQ